jgi:hypothetical protein
MSQNIRSLKISNPKHSSKIYPEIQNDSKCKRQYSIFEENSHKNEVMN